MHIIKNKKILLIDNEEGLCRMMSQVLSDSGYDVTAYTSPRKALEEFKPDTWDLVISDIKMPGVSGLEVLQQIKAVHRELPVIMITAFATVDMSIQALRKGAYDMLTKPFEPDELIFRVKNALQQSELIEENRELRRELEDKFSFEKIIGVSTPLQNTLEKVKKIAPRDISVLVTGESGTGKELIAQAIHFNSPRSEKKFIAINCGALPESILESELFGYKKGAFTGAKENKTGLIEAADGGTLFLDEVGNLPMNVQKTLLRFLQEKEFTKLGETKPTRVDVRILSATNADLIKCVKCGDFREDLYYRLNVVNIHIPPLAERRDDIPLLASHFIQQQNDKFGSSVKGFTADAIREMLCYGWPGNIRQLKNVVEACMAIDSGEQLTLATLKQFITPGTVKQGIVRDSLQTENDSDVPYSEALEQFEAELLKKLLKKHSGNIELAAKDAEMNMATIYRKLKKYGLKKGEIC